MIAAHHPTAYGTSRANAPLTPELRGCWQGSHLYCCQIKLV